MSSFICSDNHYKKVRDLTYNLIKGDRYILYDLGLDYNLPDNQIEVFVCSQVYDLYKNNVASVNLQYRDKQINRVYDDWDNNIGNKIDNCYMTMTKERLISLYNAYNCINYQIELNYNRNFIDIVQKHIAKRLIQILTDEYEYNDIRVNHWEFE